jgi:hypothetical protein
MKSVELVIRARPITTLAGAARYARDIAFSLGAKPESNWPEYAHWSESTLAYLLEDSRRTFSQDDLAGYARGLANVLTRFAEIAAAGGWTGPVAELFPVACGLVDPPGQAESR